MRLPRFFGRRRRPKLYLRRVVGTSMLPTYSPGELVVAIGPVSSVSVGDVIILSHGGMEKMKRVAQLNSKNQLYVLGDNPLASTDSRTLGWLPATTVSARIIWPRRLARAYDYSTTGR